MSLLDGVRHRLYVLLRGEAYSREIEREMRFHLELDGLPIANGDGASELAARRNFGNVTYYGEEVRNVSPLQWTDRIQQDASYAWRGLRRTPGFTATVILTLGLGLGVNAAMYSFLDQIFARPPAGVVAPEGVRRVYIKSSRVMTRTGNGVFGFWSYPRFKRGTRSRAKLRSRRTSAGSPHDDARLDGPDSSGRGIRGEGTQALARLHGRGRGHRHRRFGVAGTRPARCFAAL